MHALGMCTHSREVTVAHGQSTAGVSSPISSGEVIYEPLQSHSLQSNYRGYLSVLRVLDGDYFTVKYVRFNQ